MTCPVCHRTGLFNALGFTYKRTLAGLQEVCGKCARREFSVGPLPVVLRKHERKTIQAGR